MSRLTDRQREVYSLITQGWTQRAIANHLHITPRTVKSHYAAIRSRTDSNNTAEAVYKLERSPQAAQ